MLHKFLIRWKVRRDCIFPFFLTWNEIDFSVKEAKRCMGLELHQLDSIKKAISCWVVNLDGHCRFRFLKLHLMSRQRPSKFQKWSMEIVSSTNDLHLKYNLEPWKVIAFKQLGNDLNKVNPEVAWTQNSVPIVCKVSIPKTDI